MDLNLKGKNALVCGGSSGIGKASAIELSRLGANVTLLARNSVSLAEALSALHHEPGQEHDFVIADMANHPDLHQKITGLTTQKKIHILVNNTGGPPAGSILDADIVAFKHAFEQHLLAYHLIAQLIVPGMKSVAYGRIINVISTSVKQPLHGLGVSNTIRAAVANWSKTLANELASFHITVNNVLPGATETERLNAIVVNKATKQSKSTEEVKAEMLSEIPMKRFGKPEEIAAAVAFLATPAAAYITGTQITVDGGRTGVL
ncbi:MAG TPA: SDR family oxidoreductase [Saprospiraceae bacterium]|nr:SDR family oxidoreductase [Saprospiraceae bacterium]